MGKLSALLGIALTATISWAAPGDAVDQQIARGRERLEQLYRWFHAHPELSLAEHKTAERLASELASLGYRVQTGVGGTGVVAVLKNGRGPTILIRADMDALPIEEQTKVPYRSKVDKVMHACGHDLHMTALVGAAGVLMQLKERWKGTLVLIGQPAEERGLGARAMLEAGLLRRFPRPDYALAFHVSSELPAGIVATRSGFQLAAVDSIDIVVRGKGGHGAAPHKTVDPIVLGAQLVLALQTLVSRTLDPQKSAVLTVGTLHAGTRRNIIADRATMQLTLRTYEKEVRQAMIAGVRRIAKNLAEAAGAPLPLVTVSTGVPAVYNDPRLMEALIRHLRETLGADRVVTPPRVMMGEDFALYHDQGRVRSAMFFVGVQPKQRSGWHSVHTPRFLPDYKRALPVAVKAMASSALHLLRHRP